TGAGSGSTDGRAKRLAAERCNVAVNDLGHDGAPRVDAAITDRGDAAQVCLGDVSKDADVATLVRFAGQTFGHLDIVVNNAGISHRNKPLLEVTEEEFDRVFQVNVKSLFLTARHAVPLFRRQGSGCFVNIASTAGVRPRPGLVWYNGSKGAVIIISKAMAVELAPDKIRVNCINPVAGETPLLKTFMGEDTPARLAQFLASIPLGRFSQPRDI